MERPDDVAGQCTNWPAAEGKVSRSAIDAAEKRALSSKANSRETSPFDRWRLHTAREEVARTDTARSMSAMQSVHADIRARDDGADYVLHRLHFHAYHGWIDGVRAGLWLKEVQD